MLKMDAVQKQLLQEVAELHDIPEGAYNLRANGESVGRNSTANIEIVSKTDVSGIDIKIKSGTKNESVHIPVVLSESGLKDVDVVCYLVEPNPFIGENEEEILSMLKGVKTPVILVVNKADTVKKDELLPVIDAFSKRGDFAAVVPLSARTGDNTDELLSCIFENLSEGPMYYDEDTVTDQPMKVIAAEIIREKALHALSQEIPHGIAVVIEKMREREDPGKNIIDIEAVIYCEKDSHKGIIIGKQGSMLKKIGSNARYELERELECKVNLQLWVKVDKDWRDNSKSLKNYGFVKE